MIHFRGELDAQGRPVYSPSDFPPLGPLTVTYADLAGIASGTGSVLLYTTTANNEYIGPVLQRITVSFTGAMGLALDSISVGTSGDNTKYYDLTDGAAGVGGSGGVRPKVGAIEPTAGTEIRAYFIEGGGTNLENFTAGSVTFWIPRIALP